VRVIRSSRQDQDNAWIRSATLVLRGFDIFREAQPGSRWADSLGSAPVSWLARFDDAEIQSVGQAAAEPENG